MKRMKVELMKSWVQYPEETDFPIQNLPFGVFKKVDQDAAQNRIGVAIGDFVLDLAALVDAGLFNGSEHLGNGECFKKDYLNDFMAMGKAARVEARNIITELLSEDNATLRDNAELRQAALIPQTKVSMQLPARIGDYTDFYSSRYHATNVGIMFRGKDNALQPNWVHLPVGYHGRASSVVVDGTPIRRPSGQTRPNPNEPPSWNKCKLFDFELEMAFFVGAPNKMGNPVSIDEAEDHIFGYVLMNDWSARDIQSWEYVPLGPFNGKNFGTSISPWVVTPEALEPFKVAAEEQVPEVLPYLKEKVHSVYDISLDVLIGNENLTEPVKICSSNAKYLYWSFPQQLAHHTSTGCPMNAGDLCGSGTISGPEVGSYGSMLEISWKGTKPISLPDGSERKFLADEDEVIIRGVCHGNGYRVGFGQVAGKVLPALQ